MSGRLSAQARADRIGAFREELAQLDGELGGVLDDAQRQRITRHHDTLLAELAHQYDVATTQSGRQLALGLRLASFLGALAICIAVVLFVNRFWGALGTATQVGLLDGGHGAGAGAHGVRGPPRKDALLRRPRRPGGVRALRHGRRHGGDHLQPRAVAPGVSALRGVRRRAGVRLRAPPPAADGARQRGPSGSRARWWCWAGTSGASSSSGGSRSCRRRWSRWRSASSRAPGSGRDSASSTGMFGLIFFFWIVLLYAAIGSGSVLPFATVVGRDRLPGRRVRRGRARRSGSASGGSGIDVTYTGVIAFAMLLFIKATDWWWDWMPRWLFFLVLGGMAVGVMLILKRVKAHVGGAS